MKVFIDLRWTRTEHFDGITRYGASIAGALHKIQPVTILIWKHEQVKMLPKNVPYMIVNHPLSPKEIFLPTKLNKLGADVVFSPIQVMGTWRRKYKLIFTLHDLIYYQHPKPPTWLNPAIRIVWRLFHSVYWPQRFLLNKADYLVTVSEFSKNLIKKHKLTSKPIGVVYNAPADTFIHPKISSKTQKSLVYMGSFMPYKNVELLIKSLELLPGYTLHLLSGIAPEREAELQSLAPKNSNVKFWHGVSDEKYSELLAGAMALVTASKEEGFGLPVIEAMAKGVPVVCSNLEVFREVGGGAALFFDPDSENDFSKAVLKLENKEFRQNQIAAGKKQAKLFSWDLSAKKLLSIMCSL